MRCFCRQLFLKGAGVFVLLLLMSTVSLQAASAQADHNGGCCKSNLGPSIQAYCASPDGGVPVPEVVFVVYIGTDNQINIHDFTNNKNYTTGQYTPNTAAFDCVNGNDPQVAWQANDGSNKILEGTFVCNPFCGLYSITTFNETTDAGPALTSNGSTMYLAWAGTDSSHHLNMLTSTDAGLTWGNKKTFTDYTRSGAGVSLAYDPGGGCALACVSWIAASGTPYLYLGNYNGTSQLYDYPHSSDYSPFAPGIAAYNGTVYFIWKGNTNNYIYTGHWNITWGSGIRQSDTTYFAPAIGDSGGSNLTAFTGTNFVVYYDIGAYNY